MSKGLSSLMPQMAVEMERVNESIFEVMSMSTIDSTKIEVPTDIKTAGGEEVLAEVADFLEDQIIEQLPEPPTSPIIQAPQPKNKAAPQRQKIALTASCSEISEPTISQTFVSFKDTEVKRVTWSAKPDDLEESVLEYAKRRAGELDIGECANDLKVACGEIEKALEALGVKGKIKIAS